MGLTTVQRYCAACNLRQACKPKNAKVGQKGRELRDVTYFYNLETSSISVEWV